MRYRAERAQSDHAEQPAWVVVDADYIMQPEANAFLAALRARDRSVNTERVYAGRIAYELRSVAVPYGNGIEPSNVKAGGQACPIRFQCAGCGFYRPDPPYLPAIDEHILSLKATREKALAMGAEDFVVRNLNDQVAAFDRVRTKMRERLQHMDAEQRQEIEEASTVLRKTRASQGLPTTLTITPIESHRCHD